MSRVSFLLSLLLLGGAASPAVAETPAASSAPKTVTSADNAPALYPGGPEALRLFLLQAPYPEAARTSQVQGRVFVRFDISPEGRVENVAAVSSGPTQRNKTAALTPLEEVVQAAERHVASMPAWQPAVYQGRPIKKSMTLPVDFRLTPPASPEIEYAYADQMPIFVGATKEEPVPLNSVYKMLRYPPEALRGRIQGVVHVYFMVNEQGAIEHTEVISPVHPSLDKEALRVVNSLKVQTPASHEGKPVKVFYTVPFTFAIR